MRRFYKVLVYCSLLTSCSLAPHYETPYMPLPEHFKKPGEWVKITAPPPVIRPNEWWLAFDDPVLNDLHERLSIANQDLDIAYARFREAVALAQVARAGFFPSIQGIVNAQRQENSSTVANSPTSLIFNQYLLGLNLNYEVDVWGSVRNTVIAANRTAQASAVDIDGAYLSLHAELTNDYLTLRGYDQQQVILNATVAAYKKALFLTKKRYQGGASPIADVDEAITQLENAKTLAADLHLKRGQLENAIAVLVGEIASNFSISPGKLPHKYPPIPAIIPSTLLERRPDIVAAELRVQAANASIGVARAAFFPLVQLSAAVGFDSQSLANLLSKPSLFWSLGPLSLLTLTQPLAQVTVFDGGALIGLLNQAKAEYFETVSTYRQVVLTAFKEVENSLIAMKQLDKELHTQSISTSAAKAAWTQEQYRYTGGLVTFLQVVVAENAALQSELALISIRTQRQIASVQLIKAIGGGWGR